MYDRIYGRMTQGNPIYTESVAAAEVCLKEVSLIPTSYGRLVYLAGLRDPDTGKYGHYGSVSTANELWTDRVLRDYHESIFHQWVSFPLQAKKADVELYIASTGRSDKMEMIDTWLRLTPYKNLVPGSFQGPERQKHISDFEAILGLLKNVYGVVSPDRDA
jgi:hypothetical protein